MSSELQQHRGLLIIPLLLLLLLHLLLPPPATSAAGTQLVTEEVCNRDHRSIVCGNDSVVFIDDARYGRMNRGRCLTSWSSSSVNCSSDVRLYLEKKCAGRRSCVVAPDQTLDSSGHGCSPDLAFYLQITYHCLTVATPEIGSARDCAGKYRISPLSSKDNYLANIVTLETGIGSSTCPWEIAVKSGQTIRLSLIDFDVWSANVSQAYNRPNCPIYATVNDSGLPIWKLCGGEWRNRERSAVYTSNSNVIRVTISDGAAAEADKSYFLVRYEAVGCADFPSLPQTSIERMGNRLRAKCDGDDAVSWTMDCVDGNWSTSLQVNCSARVADWNRKKSSAEGNQYNMLLIAAAVCVAVIVSVLIVTIGFFCFFRRRIGENRKADGTTAGEFLYSLAPSSSSGCLGEERDIYRLAEGAGTMATGFRWEQPMVQVPPDAAVFLQNIHRRPSAEFLDRDYATTLQMRQTATPLTASSASICSSSRAVTAALLSPYDSGTVMVYCPYHGTVTRLPDGRALAAAGASRENIAKKEKSTDCDSALIPLLCVHG